MRFALILFTACTCWRLQATFINPADLQEATTTYSLRELVNVLPVLTKHATGDKCELQIVPKANSLVIGLASENPTWGVFDDSFELTGAEATGYARDFSSADQWLEPNKIPRLRKITSIQTNSVIENRLTFAIESQGFSVTISRTVTDERLDKLNKINKCFFRIQR